jgi:hypothetical protein
MPPDAAALLDCGECRRIRPSVAHGWPPADRYDEMELTSLHRDKEIDRCIGALADCVPSIETG